MTAQIHYDPQVIQEFALGLYRQANSIIATHTVVGGILGAAAGAVVGIVTNESAMAIAGALFIGLLGAALGLSMGRQKSFSLKLQAQTALCQLQIEANTRAAAQMRAA
jgi:outer membrane lipoprotein SlyB